MNTQTFVGRFKKWQVLLGVIVIIATLVFARGLNEPKLMVALITGSLLGYTLTRSRFGFAGGIKRIYVRGEGSLTKAILISLAIAAVLFTYIQYKASVGGALPAYMAGEGVDIIPGTQNVHMVNIATIVGAFIFGIGMIIAGGCASGTLADFGEGEGHAIIALPFFILFTIPGHYLREVIDRNPIGEIGVKAYLPDYFGHFGALIITLAGLIFLYYLTKSYERMRKAEGTYLDPKSDYEDFEKELTDSVETESTFWAIYHKLFVERWSFNTGAVILSVISAGYLVFNGKAWGVTSSFTKMAVWFVGLFGVNFADPAFASINETVAKGILNDGGVLLNIGIIIGALVAFLMAGRFNFNFEFDSRNALLFSLGGICMGFGSRLAKGCNIGAFYSSIPNFSISGWIFMVSISLGAVAALKLFAGYKSCLVPPRHRHPDDFK